MKHILIDLEESLHRAIKVHAAMKGIPMYQYIIETLKEKIKKEAN